MFEKFHNETAEDMIDKTKSKLQYKKIYQWKNIKICPPGRIGKTKKRSVETIAPFNIKGLVKGIYSIGLLVKNGSGASS